VSSFTPAYGAPEQFSRTFGATGPWTDVFAFALVLSEMVSGRDPIEGDNIAQLAFCSMNEGMRPTPRMLGAKVTDAVEAVFLKALAVNLNNRYPSAGDFWNALRVALGMTGWNRASSAPLGPAADPSIQTISTIAPSKMHRRAGRIFMSSSMTPVQPFPCF
jgi:serine/threonine protein kinase